MIWGFIDYENTGTLECIDFQAYQRIYVFCGSKNSKINLGDAAISEFLSIEIIRLKTTGADNLDFHIAYYLGKFSEKASKDVEFHIITNDNGFNGLVNHIKKTGRNCKKVAFQAKIKKKPNKPTVQLSPCAELAVSRLESIDGRKRPRKKAKLENWIGSQCRTVDENINPQVILKELNNAGLVTSVGTDIKYQLKR
ncbi:MAG: PIN domain-containing protein [Sedimenticola sp.]